ncbi:B-box zinc finger protein 21 [Prosopis cineraria]|uniref:B-box zinc finger protein 21 n=1 Tax=Prosopis cineraria TaxID=364024 RepID=UPI00240F3683|nr:B-box zinc finger protein 21 [Prosopis cineraria]
MKILCDVCNNHEASLFCTADEAALCDACDQRVHHANKLASKHQRFSLHRPSPNHFPLCDICQERRAFVFCQQDRAILCKDCDVPIHSANEHTQKHNRFLLTGIKLSAASTLYSPSTTNSVLTNGSDSVSNSKTQNIAKNSVSASSAISHPSSMDKASPSTASTYATPTINKAGGNLLTNEGIVSSSSISEYLIETLPGWQVDDFLDSSSVPFGFSKSDDMLAVFNADVERNMCSFSPESMGIWVPQAPTTLFTQQVDRQIKFQERKEATNIEASRSRSRDDNFIVPQINPPTGSKRSRLLW